MFFTSLPGSLHAGMVPVLLSSIIFMSRSPPLLGRPSCIRLGSEIWVVVTVDLRDIKDGRDTCTSEVNINDTQIILEGTRKNSEKRLMMNEEIYGEEEEDEGAPGRRDGRREDDEGSKMEMITKKRCNKNEEFGDKTTGCQGKIKTVIPSCLSLTPITYPSLPLTYSDHSTNLLTA
ncbi:hypothetical protein Pmani_027850 [Petrolisthes manimaculis]|uniref:Uncharacterized protein n=1 Tax=Petrolisthes manimaculis TaxID=1843537 RepID=A0AAE1P249_9EUCA|nr:hypothetical protein Pmani_027850 [Petrolisthes manimaculis]